MCYHTAEKFTDWYVSYIVLLERNFEFANFLLFIVVLNYNDIRAGKHFPLQQVFVLQAFQ